MVLAPLAAPLPLSAAQAATVMAAVAVPAAVSQDAGWQTCAVHVLHSDAKNIIDTRDHFATLICAAG
jgi:hypothetical protein